MPRILELFSGTGSVGNVAKTMGYEVISLDRDMQATHKVDIMDWNYQQYPPKHFHAVWASPPCTEYSRALTTRPRNIEEANKIVQRTLDILEYFEPKYWMIENPQSGLLKDQTEMWGLPWKDLDYCKYGMPYRKRTRIWNNVVNWEPKPLCKKDCGNCVGNRHKFHAQRGRSKNRTEECGNQSFKQSELYRVPSSLIEDILSNAM